MSWINTPGFKIQKHLTLGPQSCMTAFELHDYKASPHALPCLSARHEHGSMPIYPCNLLSAPRCGTWQTSPPFPYPWSGIAHLLHLCNCHFKDDSDNELAFPKAYPYTYKYWDLYKGSVFTRVEDDMYPSFLDNSRTICTKAVSSIRYLTLSIFQVMTCTI